MKGMSINKVASRKASNGGKPVESRDGLRIKNAAVTNTPGVRCSRNDCTKEC
jgi:hypothetical protein